MNTESKGHGHWWMLPVLWVAGFLAFIPLARNRFIGDDFTALSIFRHYRDAPFLQTILYGGNDFFRPLNMALIMARGGLFGDAPLPYVLSNVLLHLVNTSLVFLIAKRLFKHSLTVMGSAALFLIAFSHYEGITWISSSVTLWVTFFFLLSLYGHIRLRKEGNLGWAAMSLAGMVLAFLTKETAVSLPLILLLFDLILVRRDERGPRFWLIYLGYGVIFAAYLAVQTGWALNYVQGDSVWKPGWHILSNLADYWVWLWIPNPRHPYVAGVLSLLPRGLFITYLVLAAGVALSLPLVIVLACLKKIKGPLLWSLGAAFLSLLVFLPFTIKISARYAYLPSVFMSLFAAGVFSNAWFWLKERGKLAWRWILAVVGILYLAGNLAGLILIQREFVKVSSLTHRLALQAGELVQLEDADVVFIEGLPPHVHLREAIRWYHNPRVRVHASNDKYRSTPKTLKETRNYYRGSKETIYHLRLEDAELSLVDSLLL